MKNHWLMVSLLIVALLASYTVYAFFVLRHKAKDVSKLPPYAQVVGNDVVLARPMLLVSLNNKGMYHEHPHHLVEAEARRAEWETPLATLPAGAKLRIEQARHI